MSLKAVATPNANAVFSASSTGPNPQTFTRYYDVATGAATYLPQNIYGWNLDPALLKRWRAAVSRVQEGTGRGLVVRMGDSTTIGIDSVGPTWPNQGSYLAKMLTSAGIPTFQNSFSGNGTQSGHGSRITDDVRISVSTWVGGSNPTLGGYFFSTGAGGALSFTPETPIDTGTVYWLTNNTGGTGTIQVGTGSTAAITQSGTSLSSATATGTLGINAIKVLRSSGTQLYAMAFRAYDSTVPAIDLMDAGWYNSKMSNWVDSTNIFSSLPFLTALAPDVLILKTNINDILSATDLTTYKANITTIINAVSATTDVILETDNAIPTTSASVALQNAYVNALYEVSQASGVPLIDNYSVWGTWAAMTPLGFTGNTVHPTSKGYADMASREAAFLTAATPNGGAITAPKFNPAPTETSVTGSTSGTALFSQPQQGAGAKEVIVYCAALLGTASYTFPAPFRQTPAIVATNGLAAAKVTALSATAMTITGTTDTGFIVLKGN